MKTLKGCSEERQLLQRYVKQLDEQENRLDALRRELQALTAERQKAQDELNKFIEGLGTGVVGAGFSPPDNGPAEAGPYGLVVDRESLPSADGDPIRTSRVSLSSAACRRAAGRRGDRGAAARRRWDADRPGSSMPNAVAQLLEHRIVEAVPRVEIAADDGRTVGRPSARSSPRACRRRVAIEKSHEPAGWRAVVEMHVGEPQRPAVCRRRSLPETVASMATRRWRSNGSSTADTSESGSVERIALPRSSSVSSGFAVAHRRHVGEREAELSRRSRRCPDARDWPHAAAARPRTASPAARPLGTSGPCRNAS